MLTELGVTNFKSWQKIERMRLGPITGLFGSNSSGKTSILQLLLMLKQTVDSADRAQPLILGDERSLADLGSLRDVLYGHGLSGGLHWTASWDLPRPLKVTDPADEKSILFSDRHMRFEAEVSDNGSGRMIVQHMLYAFADQCFTLRRKEGKGGKYELQSSGADFTFRRTQGRPWDLPGPVKCYGFPDQVKAYFQNAGFLSDLELAFEELFGRVYYLCPLREDPKRQYVWSGAEPADMGRRGERVVDALLAAREQGVTMPLGRGRKRPTLEEYVAQWLKRLGLVHSLSVEAIAKDSSLYRVLVQKSPASAKVLIPDVGFGVSQILPVLVICYYVPKGSTIILEQPEIHLHPSVQAGLADVFIDAIEKRNVQILFESHSEHLLRRLQRRIAEATLSPKDAALYFCDMTRDGSRLTNLQLDIFGNITNWPEDFFGDEFGEMAAMTKAAMARKKAGQT